MDACKFKRISILSILLIFIVMSRCCPEEDSPLFWPAPPAAIRVSFLKSIYSAQDLGIKKGLFEKLKAVIIGHKKDGLNKPTAVSVDKQKRLYVCDQAGSALHIFLQKEKNYKIITRINKEDLLSPVGVAVSENGSIFVSDSALKKVYCLDKDFKFKFVLGKFLRPTGLVVYKNKLYVVDTLAHKVSVFNLEGKLISEFGKRGRQEGSFNYPTSIAVDPAGNLYIVDTLNFRIQVFDNNNKFLFTVGGLGDSSGSFSRPKAIAVDSFGHIYVTDSMFDNIQIFNKRKEFLLSIGKSGGKEGEFWIISGIAIDQDNYIYAADSYNKRIQIFRYVGKD